MFRNTALLLALSCGSACIAMEEKRWVQEASQISVQTMKTSFDVPIDNETTILGVKQELHNSDSIPVDQQSLKAFSSKPWTLGLVKELSDDLDNTRRVKEVMNTYNTNVFQLILRLKTPQ